MLLDTNVLLWLVNSDRRVSPRVRRRLLRSKLYVSAATCFEIAFLTNAGRIRLHTSAERWVDEAIETLMMEVFPIDEHIALRAGDLANSLRDPIDCLIAATALTNDLELVTSDERLQALPGLRSVW